MLLLQFAFGRHDQRKRVSLQRGSTPSLTEELPTRNTIWRKALPRQLAYRADREARNTFQVTQPADRAPSWHAISSGARFQMSRLEAAIQAQIGLAKTDLGKVQLRVSGASIAAYTVRNNQPEMRFYALLQEA